MSEEAYADYLDAATAGYAEDNVASGRWPAEGALERARADFAESLPHGLHTPDNYLYEIRATETGPTVGVLWFAVQEKNGLRVAFVYDIEVKREFRRRGHATAAFIQMESLVRDLGLTGIGLHVFGRNTTAQDLYRKLGYDITGVNMLKKLGANGT
jgi:ribosomal protein S18 acetylase RimI-like enzyme